MRLLAVKIFVINITYNTLNRLVDMYIYCELGVVINIISLICVCNL